MQFVDRFGGVDVGDVDPKRRRMQSQRERSRGAPQSSSWKGRGHKGVGNGGSWFDSRSSSWKRLQKFSKRQRKRKRKWWIPWNTRIPPQNPRPFASPARDEQGGADGHEWGDHEELGCILSGPSSVPWCSPSEFQCCFMNFNYRVSDKCKTIRLHNELSRVIAGSVCKTLETFLLRFCIPPPNIHRDLEWSVDKLVLDNLWVIWRAHHGGIFARLEVVFATMDLFSVSRIIAPEGLAFINGSHC